MYGYIRYLKVSTKTPKFIIPSIRPPDAGNAVNQFCERPEKRMQDYLTFYMLVYWVYLLRLIVKKMQFDVGVSPPANIMTFRQGLTYLTFDHDPIYHCSGA